MAKFGADCLMGAAWQSQAQDTKAEDGTYASIAPIDQ